MTENTSDAAPGKPREPHPGLPRWVKLLAIGAATAAVALVLVMLLVGGEHGPGMHG
ncbi:hypothetical protein [Antribacter gilvus]|uniref:hypothetical protein n=1 Tax=Antribacter gilvus TaxID=2304675 RepID=UPI0013E0686C|nr:hypothetical protein [Antribacter gilvus]